MVDLGHGRQATIEILGEGPPMLWFEGGPGLPARMSRPDAALLADIFSVYLIDPHGSGGSTPPADSSQYDHIGHARFYDEVRRALGLQQVTIAGISFGGAVALTYTSLYPAATVRCIAVSAFALGSEIDEGEAAAEMERMLSRHAGASWYEEARKVWDGWTERVLAAEDPAEVEHMLRTWLPFTLPIPTGRMSGRSSSGEIESCARISLRTRRGRAGRTRASIFGRCWRRSRGRPWSSAVSST
jgi:pimeloyl-ACP methyl ester carboxylesterase